MKQSLAHRGTVQVDYQQQLMVRRGCTVCLRKADFVSPSRCHKGLIYGISASALLCSANLSSFFFETQY